METFVGSLDQEDKDCAVVKAGTWHSGLQNSAQNCQICILQSLTQTASLFIPFFSVRKQRMQKNNMFKFVMTVVFYCASQMILGLGILLIPQKSRKALL